MDLSTYDYTPSPHRVQAFTAPLLTLPADVVIDEVYSPQQGWLVKTYLVRNDDPFLGKAGANAQAGRSRLADFGNAGHLRLPHQRRPPAYRCWAS